MKQLGLIKTERNVIFDLYPLRFSAGKTEAECFQAERQFTSFWRVSLLVFILQVR